MSDVAEGLGAAIEGSLAAKAVEPSAGKAPGKVAESDECANCGSSVAGDFCASCGQKVHIHRTLTAVAHDLVHGVLHLDGKLSHTLPMLILKPGKLTRRYIEGERARFVSPMSMFLFSVFSMFAVFQIVGIGTPTSFELETGMDAIETRLGEAVERNRVELAKVEDQLETNDPDPDERNDLEQRKVELEAELYEFKQVESLPFIESDVPAPQYDENGKRVVEIGDSGNAQMTFGETGFEFLDKGLAKKWKENPGLMLYKLQANAYKFSWLLIPLSIPFVWLTFAWKRQFKAYDHAIFVTYSLAFMSLLFITASLFTISGSWMWVGVFMMIFVPPIHLYKQLRGAYYLSRFSTLWRLIVLSAFIWIVIGLFLQTLLILGAF